MTKTKFHPLRPKQGAVLICEGKIDSDFVESVISPYIPQLMVSYGQGRELLPKLAAVFSPAFYLWDRDFRFSLTEAQTSLSLGLQKPRLIWSHVDIESYLLYPDWLWQFIQDAQSAPIPLKIAHPPHSQTAIELDLVAIAKSLVHDHAGRCTVEWVNKNININKRGNFGMPQGIQDGKKISSIRDWEIALSDTAKIIQGNLQNAVNAPEFSDILNIYANQITEHQNFVASLTSIRVHFSGKRILMLLADKWGIQGVTINQEKFADWEIIQKNLIASAINYSKSISGKLSQDSRLSDFGYVASKLLGQLV